MGTPLLMFRKILFLGTERCYFWGGEGRCGFVGTRKAIFGQDE